MSKLPNIQKWQIRNMFESNNRLSLKDLEDIVVTLTTAADTFRTDHGLNINGKSYFFEWRTDEASRLEINVVYQTLTNTSVRYELITFELFDQIVKISGNLTERQLPAGRLTALKTLFVKDCFHCETMSFLEDLIKKGFFNIHDRFSEPNKDAIDSGKG